MKNIKLLLVIPISFAFIGSGYSLLSSGGKAGVTGSPGEGTCIQCHSSFGLNAGDGTILLNSDALEASGWEFEAGMTYDLSLNILHDGASLFGFAVEALDSQGADAGTLIVTDESATKLMSANIGGNERTNLVHVKDGGIADDEKTFSFQWQAPENVDSVTFYFVANAADGSSGTTGDYIYSSSQIAIKKSATTSVSEKLKDFTIAPNPASGIINLSGFEQAIHSVLIYDLSGRLVQRAQSESFNVENIKQGNYIMIVKGSNSKIIGKQLFTIE